jgi:hypothetical protein
MDFITGLPITNKKHDSIMVVVDKLTKAAHFVPVKTMHTMINIAEISMKEFARLHGFSKNKIHYFKNDSPKFYRIKLFYLKNHQNFIKTI